VKLSIIKTVLFALAVGMSASLSWAADPQPQKAKPANAADTSKAAAKRSKATGPRVEPVDINSASKEDLKKLPGIGDTDADKIIAGRPYLTKAHLQTRNIVSSGVYQALSPLVVARQKDAKFGKDVQK
jgi:DNA uptake protein ComE-like DNA-binding protein